MPHENLHQPNQAFPSETTYSLSASREVYLPKHNRLFAKDPKNYSSAFVPLKDMNLDYILAEKYHLMVSNDHIISSKRAGITLEILPSKNRLSYVKAKVDVYKHTDESISVLYQGHPLNFVPYP